RAGLTWRGESTSRYDLQVTNTLGAALPINVPTLRFAGISQFDPHTVALEVAFGVPRTDGVLVATQLQWQHWSAIPSLVRQVTPSSPGPRPPGLRDTVNARLGLEWTRDVVTNLRISLRAGYAFVMSPAPEASPERTVLDAHRHVLSAGAELFTANRLAPLH